MSLANYKVFRPVVQIPEGVMQLIEYKWIFVNKCNDKTKILNHKAWLLIAQSFSHKLGINHIEHISLH